MDLNGDGHDDIISGSYMPGSIYLFPGAPEGVFTARQELVEAPEYDYRNPPEGISFLASVPYAFDYDGDGDFDLIVGNIRGEVFLLENTGTAKAPSFGPDSVQLRAGDTTVRVDGDAGPAMTDWDSDGKVDLLVGAGDGSVTWFRNTSDSKEPTFEEGRTLIEGIDWQTMMEAGPGSYDPKRSQMRAKVCATDYDGDGRLDLLVGDFGSEELPPPDDLTEEQMARRDELRGRQEEMESEMMKIYESIEPDENGEITLDFESNPGLQKLQDEMMEVYEELQPLEGGTQTHGYVWVYLRKAEEKRADAEAR